jgi:molybdopterin converting factor small subunit
LIRVTLPAHLRNLAKVSGEVTVEVDGNVTADAIVEALEARYPMLRGTIRDRQTLQRRAFVRYYACSEDISHAPTDVPLPEEIVSGKEPFMIVGAMAGG